ncbi:hypothetical protein QOT17_016840 [Balamuthia mandrillaris]
MEAPVGSGGSRTIAAANEEGASLMLFWFHWFLVVSPDLIFDAAWIIDVCLRRRRLSYLSPSASGYAPLSREAAGLLAYSMISTALFTFAGSTLVSLFVLQSPPAWVTANNGLPLAMLGWFLIFQVGPLRWLLETKVAQHVLLLLSSVLWVRSILWAVEVGTRAYPSVMAALVAGTLGGCGGAVLHQLEGKAFSYPKTSSCLVAAKVSLLSSALVYALQHGLAEKMVMAYMPSGMPLDMILNLEAIQQHAKWYSEVVLGVVLIVWCFLDYYGLTLDPFTPLEAILLKMESNYRHPAHGGNNNHNNKQASSSSSSNSTSSRDKPKKQ